ncbi:MAG TPA: hypothetical protein IAA45_12405 [Candidatus Blautia gallistercoris]|uniref:Uncharacterized protein n=1 Tax=Candidatus Blautia gallistercoris TaxID=2838490 RepID=A0A9D1WJU8_9FIRM|nr:hypothetical protein [Candidatus Blautia gallistercoris]
MRTTKKAETKATETAATANVETPVETAPVEKAEKTPAKETKKTTRKTTATKKSAAAKTTAAKRTTRKKAHVVNQEVYIQFWGKEVYAKDVVDRIKNIWETDMGRKPEELLDLKVYIKPEENGAHYVINGEITGFIGL